MPMLRLADVRKAKRWEGFKINRAWEHLDKCGRFTDFRVHLGPYQGVKDAWKDQPCVVVGAGPSLKGFDWKLLDGFRTITMNHVIEDYDKSDWHVFLDNRFLVRTKYDINKYKGKLFSSNKCQLLPENLDVVRFRPMSWKESPTERIEDGLYNGCLTALCGLHLAIISGANPIYIIGIDCGGGNWKDYHYKKDYTAAAHNEKKYRKYVGTANYFRGFSQWSYKIKNLSKTGNLDMFKRVDVKVLKKHKGYKISQEPTICHVIGMNNMKEMGDISRQVYNRSYGRHIYSHIGSKQPKADVYLLECFINNNDKYINFIKPYAHSKVVSLIHSSSKCNPAKRSDKVVTITNAWKMVMKNRGYDSIMIPAAIDTNIYNHKVDYKNMTFGRITRYSMGKVHPDWNSVIMRILNSYADAKCIMYTQRNNRLTKHPRLIVDDSIKINELGKKAKKLAKLSLFADMHNTFVETFSLCLLEAMACGLPVVMYSKAPQQPMWEVMGGTGIVCRTPGDFESTIMELLPDTERKKEMGLKARERAKEYTIDKMIEKYDKLFKEILK
jgi:glycosyltransferase involved in cell wall biosynthesis